MNRKKAHPIDVGSLARAYTERAILRLGGIMERSKDENVAVAASKVLLERGWGRPVETKELKGELKVVLRHMLGDDK